MQIIKFYLAPPTTFEVWKFALALLRWGEMMADLKLCLPIKLSGRALYDNGQMINRNVINHVIFPRSALGRLSALPDCLRLLMFITCVVRLVLLEFQAY